MENAVAAVFLSAPVVIFQARGWARLIIIYFDNPQTERQTQWTEIAFEGSSTRTKSHTGTASEFTFITNHSQLTFVQEALEMGEDIGQGGQLFAVLQQLRQVVGDRLWRLHLHLLRIVVRVVEHLICHHHHFLALLLSLCFPVMGFTCFRTGLCLLRKRFDHEIVLIKFLLFVILLDFHTLHFSALPLETRWKLCSGILGINRDWSTEGLGLTTCAWETPKNSELETLLLSFTKF